LAPALLTNIRLGWKFLPRTNSQFTLSADNTTVRWVIFSLLPIHFTILQDAMFENFFYGHNHNYEYNICESSLF